MLNLLPQQDKKEVVTEQWLRFSVVTLFFLSALGIFGTTLLSSSFFLSREKEASATRQNETLEKDIARESGDRSVEILKNAAHKASALMAAADADPGAYELVQTVVGHRPSSIKITGIAVKSTASGGRTLSITGEARDRDALLAFSHTLESEKAFSSVSVPVSNFAEAEDINFSILVDVRQPK